MNQLTGNQLAVVLQAERSMLLASGRPKLAEPTAPKAAPSAPEPANLTEQQKINLIVHQLRAEVVPLKFGGNRCR